MSALRRWLEDLRLWWLQVQIGFGWRCSHLISQRPWRPIALRGQPGRLCSECDETEMLTPEDYYAQFGRVFPRPIPFVPKAR